MNAITKSPNQLPHHEDWSRYDSPTVVRRHGREFLERTWKNSLRPRPAVVPSKAELREIVCAHGGEPITLAGLTLLFFPDVAQAIACENRLCSLGLALVRDGKQIQLRGYWL